jgi:hypothetical protein
LTHFNEDKLREFLLAMMASGTRPSASLVKALTKLSGVEEALVQTMFKEVFEPSDSASQTTRMEETGG